MSAKKKNEHSEPVQEQEPELNAPTPEEAGEASNP